MKKLIVPSSTATLTTVEVAFNEYKYVEPESLHSFNEDYKKIFPALAQFINQSQGKIVSIPVGRIQNDGSFKTKILNGQVCEVGENNFFFKTKEDLSSVYDHPAKILIRLDNALGMIPLHPDYPDMNPLTVNIREFRSYFKALTGMRNLLAGCIGTEHALTLYYRYSKKNSNFRKGGYRSEGEVLEVNKSNIVYNHMRTFTHIPGQLVYDYVDMRPRIETDRFVAPDRYLSRVVVILGTKHEINVHADNDEN